MSAVQNGVYAVRVNGRTRVGSFIPEEILEQNELNRKTRISREQADARRRIAAMNREKAAFRRMAKEQLIAAAICLNTFGVHQAELASLVVTVPVMIGCLGFMCFVAGCWVGRHQK